MQRMNLWDEALPFLEGLVRDTGETGHLAVLDGGEAIYIERVEARRPLRVPSAIGRGYPAHATNLGKVLLADLPRERVVEIVATHGLAAYTPQHDHRPRRARGRARAHPRGAATRSTTRSTTTACAASGRGGARPLAAASCPRSASAGRSPGSRPSASRSCLALVMTAAVGLSRRLGAHQSGAYASATLRVRTTRPTSRPCRPGPAHESAPLVAVGSHHLPTQTLQGDHDDHGDHRPESLSALVEPHLALRPAQAVGVHAQGGGARARDRQARHPLREGRLPGR